MVTALERMGSAQIGSYCFRSAWAFVTLTGAPGVGKTRLAVPLANQLRTGYAGGVCMVSWIHVRMASRPPNVP